MKIVLSKWAYQPMKAIIEDVNISVMKGYGGVTLKVLLERGKIYQEYLDLTEEDPATGKPLKDSPEDKKRLKRIKVNYPLVYETRRQKRIWNGFAKQWQLVPVPVRHELHTKPWINALTNVIAPLEEYMGKKLPKKREEYIVASKETPLLEILKRNPSAPTIMWVERFYASQAASKNQWAEINRLLTRPKGVTIFYHDKDNFIRVDSREFTNFPGTNSFGKYGKENQGVIQSIIRKALKLWTTPEEEDTSYEPLYDVSKLNMPLVREVDRVRSKWGLPSALNMLQRREFILRYSPKNIVSDKEMMSLAKYVKGIVSTDDWNLKRYRAVWHRWNFDLQIMENVIKSLDIDLSVFNDTDRYLMMLMYSSYLRREPGSWGTEYLRTYSQTEQSEELANINIEYLKRGLDVDVELEDIINFYTTDEVEVYERFAIEEINPHSEWLELDEEEEAEASSDSQ